MTNKPDPTLKIWTGRHVELELRYSDGETERLALDVVPDAAADFDRGFLGESTALAKAVLGRVTGEVTEYQAGDWVRVRILAVYPEWKGQPEDLSARRDENLRKAIRTSEDTNAVLFASSFSGKWGDYDPNAVPKEDVKDAEDKDKDTGEK